VTTERVTLFSVPKNDYLKSQWINVVCAVNNRETNVKFVCAKHFKTEDIKRAYYGSENLGSEVIVYNHNTIFGNFLAPQIIINYYLTQLLNTYI